MRLKHFKGKADSKESGIKIIEEFLSQFDFSTPVHIEMSPVSPTLDYKALFAIWCASCAKSFTDRDKAGRIHAKEDIHDLICHKFLGYTKARKIGKQTTIEPALRTLTYPKQLKRGEFYHLMQEFEMWASDVGVTLPQNESQYTEDKAKQVA